jgi:spermidine/putrescine transport system ATP-binding protein
LNKDHVLEFINVTKSYGNEEVIKDIKFFINRGEFVTLLGPSGCGKTTILRLIGGFETPDRGEIYIDSIRANDISPANRKVNTVFQSYALFPHINVYENIAFGLRVDTKNNKEIKNKVYDIAQKTGLEKLLFKMPSQLSGGQKQRVAIARAVVKEPEILLLDEPLNALDKNLRQKMQIELKQLQEKLKITFMLVTHDQEEALSVADKVIVMNDKKIEQIGTPREVYETPSNLFVAKFIGEINVFEATVLSVKEDKVILLVEGSVKYETKNELNLLPNEKVKLLFRPEDLSTETIKDSKTIDNVLIGKVTNTTYKGATLDSSIVLKNGKEIKASEFFDEDDEDFDYKVGENVTITWISGWEVILRNE